MGSNFQEKILKRTDLKRIWRKSAQHLLPVSKPPHPNGGYDIYPAFRLGEDQIFEGFEALAGALAQHNTVIIDGYGGVFYDHFRERLDLALRERGLKASWTETSGLLKSGSDIDTLISPFMGADDPLFGKRAELELRDFFRPDAFLKLTPDPSADINLIIGPGAAFSGWKGLLVYIDIPKNEIQFRSRAGSVANLGALGASDPKVMYKRFYFIDWPVLNSHKGRLLPDADLIIDSQRPENPIFMQGDLLRKSVNIMSRNVFRARPWFEPGVWGGTWIRDHIDGLSREVPNYAWSFELIVPENGLLFESSGLLLEVAFDTLMYLESEAVLGECHARFRTEFPIRFDFLDTFDGGNLSIQVHPNPEYAKRSFGENFTQEETYYILDSKDKAYVYLGFQDNIDPELFRTELEASFNEQRPAGIERFVQKHPASRHDLFLIPYGTIHGSGIDNLVLEISSTPYIFTFKLYDWVRPDLDGKPRSLNIGRGIENLNFDRKGDYVRKNLISSPVLIDHGDDWQLVHLQTHEQHLYDVHRYHFRSGIKVETKNKCHVLSLVEGTAVLVETQNGMTQKFSYAETFVIPAAAGSYRVTNLSGGEAMLVKAFVK